MARARDGAFEWGRPRRCYFDAMQRLVVSEFISVDGVMEDPGGSEKWERGGWVDQFDRGDEGDKFKLDEVMAAEALLLGRKTYEGFAQAWPSRTDEVGFAEKMNSMPKYVVSTTLQNPEWDNSTVISENVPQRVSELRDRAGSDVLVYGSAQLSQWLTRKKLVDE